MKKIIFTGGGTGGHIMPNLALIEALQHKYKCQYIGSKNSMEQKLVEPVVDFFSVETCKLKRSLSLSNLLIPFKLIKGYFDAKNILKTQKPDLVFSKGGYVSVPVVLAAHSLKIPVVAHESDLSIGLANKLTQKYAKVVCTSFESTSKKLKNGVFVGSPLRKHIFCGSKQNFCKKYYINQNLPTLLVIGGSLGSQALNNLIFENQQSLCKNFNIIHLCGNNFEKTSNIKNYHIIKQSNDMGNIYATCDIALTRGGSNVLFELLALKKPMLIVPLQKGSRGDQVENATEFEKMGVAEVLFEDALQSNNQILTTKLNQILSNKKTYAKNAQKFAANGTQNIIKQIEKVLSKKIKNKKSND